MGLSQVEVVILVSGVLILIRFVNSRSWGKCKDTHSLKGKTFIVTGGGSGIGKATVTSLVERGANVVVACRNVDQTIAALKPSPLITCKHLDLQSFASVVKFVQDVDSSLDRVNVLISNAGVYGTPFTLTTDGFELQHQVNHLGHALLQLLLLPKLESSGTDDDPSRIVCVTSTRGVKATIKWDELTAGAASVRNYNRSQSYDSSKLSAVLFNMELAKRLKQKGVPVTIMMASPGLVWTNLFRHEKKSLLKMLLFAPVAFAFMRTAKQGSQTVLHCATSSSLSDQKYSGQVFRNCHITSRFDKRAVASDVYAVWQKTIQATEPFLSEEMKQKISSTT